MKRAEGGEGEMKDVKELEARVRFLEQELEEERKVRRIYEGRGDREVHLRVQKEIDLKVAELESEWQQKEKLLSLKVGELQTTVRQQEDQFLTERESLIHQHNALLVQRQAEWQHLFQSKDEEIRKARDYYAEEIQKLKAGQATERETWERMLTMRDQDVSLREREMASRIELLQETLARREEEGRQLLTKLSEDRQQRDQLAQVERKKLLDASRGQEAISMKNLQALQDEIKRMTDRHRDELKKVQVTHAEELTRTSEREQDLRRQVDEAKMALLRSLETGAAVPEAVESPAASWQEERKQLEDMVAERDRLLQETVAAWQSRITAERKARQDAEKIFKHRIQDLQKSVSQQTERLVKLQGGLVEQERTGSQAVLNQEMMKARLEEEQANTQKAQTANEELVRALRMERDQYKQQAQGRDQADQASRSAEQHKWLDREAMWKQMVEEREGVIKQLKGTLTEESARTQVDREAEKQMWQQIVDVKQAEILRLQQSVEDRVARERAEWVTREQDIQRALTELQDTLRRREEFWAAQAAAMQEADAAAKAMWERERTEIRGHAAQQDKRWKDRVQEAEEQASAVRLALEEIRHRETGLLQAVEKYQARLQEVEQERREEKGQWQAAVARERAAQEEWRKTALDQQEELAILKREEAHFKLINEAHDERREEALKQEVERLKAALKETEQSWREQMDRLLEATRLETDVRDTQTQEERLSWQQQLAAERQLLERERQAHALALADARTVATRQLHDERQEESSRHEAERLKAALHAAEQSRRTEVDQLMEAAKREAEDRHLQWHEERESWQQQLAAERQLHDRERHDHTHHLKTVRTAATQRERELRRTLEDVERRFEKSQTEWQKRLDDQGEYWKLEIERLTAQFQGEHVRGEEALAEAYRSAERDQGTLKREIEEWRERVVVHEQRAEQLAARLTERDQHWREQMAALNSQVVTTRHQAAEAEERLETQTWNQQEILRRVEEEHDQAIRRTQDLEEQLKVAERKWMLKIQEGDVKLAAKEHELAVMREELTKQLMHERQEHEGTRAELLEEFKRREQELLLARVEVQDQLRALREEWKKREQELLAHIDELNGGFRDAQKRHLEELAEAEREARVRLAQRETEWQKNLKEQYVTMKLTIGEMAKVEEQAKKEADGLNRLLRDAQLQAKSKEQELQREVEGAKYALSLQEQDYAHLQGRFGTLDAKFKESLVRKDREIEEERRRIQEVEAEYRQARDRFGKLEKDLRLELTRSVQFYEERLREQEPQYRALLEQKELQVQKLTGQVQHASRRHEEREEEFDRVTQQLRRQLEETRDESWKTTEALRAYFTRSFDQVRSDADQKEQEYRTLLAGLRDQYEPMVWELKRNVYLLQAKLETRTKELEDVRSETSGALEKQEAAARHELTAVKGQWLARYEEVQHLAEELTVKEQRARETAAEREQELLESEERWRTRIRMLEGKHLRELQSWSELLRMKEETVLIPFREPSSLSVL